MFQLLEDIAKPISDAEPAGEDIAKLNPSPENEQWIQSYAELRGLINRVASNCESIVALSQSILAGKSKDLRIAGHLCMGLLHQRGLAGLAEGLKGYHILLEEYWDNGLHPSREAARTRNIMILDERLASDISARAGDSREYFIPAAATDAQALEDIKETAEAIKAVLAEKIPDKPISMENIVRVVDSRLREVATTAKKPEPVQKAPARTTPTTPTRVVEVRETEPAEEPAVSAIKSEVDAVKAVIQAANFLLPKDPKNPASYRLLRSSLWYLLPLFNPEPNSSGKRVTQYAAPAGKSRLEELLRDEDWESLATECEAVFVERFDSGGGGCFCLDIQRFLSVALKEMATRSEEGGDRNSQLAYETVHRVILQETAILVERFPWITELFYSNETPFADGQTKNWIEKTVKPVLGTGTSAQRKAATIESSPAEGTSQISEDFDKALELLGRQKWNEALDLMQKGIDADPTRKGRFQRRLNLASLCLDAGQPVMARPLLEQLDEEIELFSLDQWEPGLCVQVWNSLKQCYHELLSQQGQQAAGASAPATDGLYQEKADRIFEKICRLDIRAALTSNTG